jgi:hypothetical protein
MFILQAVDHVIELLVDDDNSRPSSVNSEVISIADGSSDIEHIVSVRSVTTNNLANIAVGSNTNGDFGSFM